MSINPEHKRQRVSQIVDRLQLELEQLDDIEAKIAAIHVENAIFNLCKNFQLNRQDS